MTPAPIFPLWFKSGLVVMVLASIAVASTTTNKSESASNDTALHRGDLLEQITLYFIDQPNGDVAVVDASNNLEIHRLTIGEGGFMRSVVRGLARERRAAGEGPEVPFKLAVWQTGLVSLIDPVTNRTIELSAFGPDNVMAFTQLLPGTRDNS